MINLPFLVESFTWLATMLLVSGFSLRFAYKLWKHDPEKAAMPKVNIKEGVYLFFTLGINYLVVGIGCCILYLLSSEELRNAIHIVVKSCWILEVFIFFNIITAYALYSANRRVIINI